MSSESRQLDTTIQEETVSVEPSETQESVPQSASFSRIGGAVRELKSILALSKEAKFDVNLPKKRKSDHRRSSNESPSKSNMPKKEHRLTRFPVTAESELEMDLVMSADPKPSEDSPSKPFKKKKSILYLESPNVSGSSDEKRKERRSLSSGNLGDIAVFKPNKDIFCWRCHREGVNIACETCPRSYHSRCLKQTIEDPEHWPCPECVTILKAESTQSRSPAMRGMTLEHLCSLLKFAALRMKQVAGSAPFVQPVDTKDFPEYEKYIIQPMDLSCLEKNIKENLYGSTHAFEADAKWILHNSIVFNSYQSKLTSVAKTIMKICKQEMAEIENCPTCYLNANTKKNTWFVEVCPKPHLLVWAKLKGFPFWPGKVMSCRDGNVDVRFFGAHDRAWVPEKECFLYMPRDPNGFRSKRNDIEKCIQELEVHVENLKQVFGLFCYPECKIPIDPSDELRQLQIFLPQYKSYVNRNKRHKLFHNVGKIGPEKVEEEEKKMDVEKADATEETVEQQLLDESKTEQDAPPTDDLKESSSKDEEVMEGYGTDDESMPLIDIRTRKKLLGKISDDGQSNSEEMPTEKEMLKGFSNSEKSISESPDALAKDIIEKNFDPKLLLSDSSRLSEKISTVDVLEDMEINLGKDEGTSCVNISRKNSFDSSDYSKSDTESNTSSRKGPVKMDVENFEVILTSPTKMKIVDKLMKRLSDGTTEEKKVEHSSKDEPQEVARTVPDVEDERQLEEARYEMSPEPKQLEEPPINFSENESEIVEGNEKIESLSNEPSDILKNDVENEPELEKEENIISTEKIESDIPKNPTDNIYVIEKTKEQGRDDSTERLKIKLKLSKVETEKEIKKDETTESTADIIKNKSVVEDSKEKTTEENGKNEDDIKECKKDSKRLSLKGLNKKENDLAGSSEFQEWAWKVVGGELCSSSKEEGKINENDVVKPSQEECADSNQFSKKNKHAEQKEKSKTKVAKDDVPQSSSKSDLEQWTKKVLEMGSMESVVDEQKIEKRKSPVLEEIEQMEDEDDDIPLAQIQSLEKIDKENILKVIHSDLLTETPESEEIPTTNSSTETLDVPPQTDATSLSNPDKESDTCESESSPEKDKTVTEKPETERLQENINLKTLLDEVANSKNVELVSEPVSNVSNDDQNRSESKGISETTEEGSTNISNLAPRTRKRKLSATEEDQQKKAKADDEEPPKDPEQAANDEKMDTDEEKATEEVEKAAEKETDLTCQKNIRQSPERESLPQALAERTPPRKSSTQSTSSHTSNSNSSAVGSTPRPTPEVQHLDDAEIKSEPDSDSEYPTESVGENLEAKKKYLSALNILERDSEAFHRQKDKPGEIRTRSKTEERREKSRIVDNLTKIIDDVAVNYGVKKGAEQATAHVSLTRLQRRSLDEQQIAKTVAPPTAQHRSENGEIYVKSFAKIVPTKPRARKSFPQSFSTEARQIQQIKMARREDGHHHQLPALAAIRRENPETKLSTPSTPPTITKMTKENANSSSSASTGTPMQQLENMNKSFIIVTSQNQDVVLLPPNKPISYHASSQPAVMSVVPALIPSVQGQPSPTPTQSFVTLCKPKTSEKVTKSVNLTNSQNYIPFKEPERASSLNKKQVSLLVSNNNASVGSTVAGTTAAVNVTTTSPATEDEEMPLQSGSVTSNDKDGAAEATGSHIVSTNGIDGVSSMQEDSNGPTQSEDTAAIRESNAEDDEFRLINNLIPGGVAKVVHEIVQRPPPKLKPRPPGMLSTVFSEGVPSSAGTVTSKINSVAHRLSDYLRGMLIETLDDLGKSGNSEATVASLKLEIEALKHKHSIELSEIEKNMCTVLKDIQRSIVEDRERIIEETRASCEAETIKRIEEAKSKQWCANCLKEAQFYCCWNTSYCDYPCQQKHWPQHMTKCTQNSGGATATAGGGAQSAAGGLVSTVVRPIAGQQLILRPSAKPGTLGRVFAKPVQKVYLNRNTTASKTLRVQSANGSYLTVMEAPPGQYQVVSTLPSNTVMRTANAPSKKPPTVTPSTSAKPTVQKLATIVSQTPPSSAPTLFEEDSD